MNVVLVTNCIPSYRRDFIARVADTPGVQLTVICSEVSKGSGLSEAVDDLRDIQVIRTRSLLGGRVFWQRLPWKDLIEGEAVVVVMGNPRYLSNMLLSFLLCIKHKPRVVFGHAFSSSSTEYSAWARLQWWKYLFDAWLVYTDKEARLLHSYESKGISVLGIQNGLNQDEIDREARQWSTSRLTQWQAKNGLEQGKVLLSCARLTQKNHFDEFIQVFQRLLPHFKGLKWVIIGEGPQRDRIHGQVIEHGLEDHIILTGAIYEESLLAPYFLSASLLIHPGSIGLSVMHAFGYGLPVITHDEESRHAPEIAALKDGHNGVVFPRADWSGLERQTRRVLGDEPLLKLLSDGAIQTARTEFNTSIMAKRFLEICEMAVDSSQRS